MRARFRLVLLCILVCLGGRWLPSTVDSSQIGAAHQTTPATEKSIQAVTPETTDASGGNSGSAASVPEKPSVHVLKTVTLAVDPVTNAASGIVQLTNPTNADVNLSLYASDFVSCTTGRGLNSKVVFSVPVKGAGQEVLETQIKANETLTLKVEATNLWEAGDSLAEIFSHETSLGKLRASKYRPAFAVKLDSATPDKPEIEFTNGKPQEIVLKNDDSMTYVVDARVTIDSRSKEISGLSLPANGTVSFQVDPDPEWFDIESDFRRQVSDGRLTLRFAPPGASSPSGLPVKQIAFKANLVGNRFQPYWSFLFVILFATIGGICSLLLSNWVPNKIKRADLFDKLDNLSGPIRDVSNRVDSGLRVLLRVERHRLKAMLRSSWVFSAEFGQMIKSCDAKIDVLIQQIKLAKQLSNAYRDLESVTATDLIPSKLESIAKFLQRAADLLRRSEPTTGDLQSALDSISAANACIAAMSQEDKEFEESLTKRVAALTAFRTSITGLAPVPNPLLPVLPSLPPLLLAIQNAVPGAFAGFDPDLLVDVAPQNYAAIDVKIMRVELVRAYAEHCDPTYQAANPPYLGEFAAFLNKRTSEGVRHALDYLAQVKQGIFGADLKNAIIATPPLIVVEPTPMQDQLVKFSIRFPEAQPKLNAAVAKNEVLCEFNFGHADVDLAENGWDVFHFFPAPRRSPWLSIAGNVSGRNKAAIADPNRYNVTATYFFDGKPVVDANHKPVVSRKEVNVQPLPVPLGDRNKAEAVRLSIALIVALIGLVAGGQEQLAKLEIVPAAIAVFVLGFSADTVKNLISQKS